MTEPQMSWDDVCEGQTLPPLVIEVTYSTLAKDVAATHDMYPIHHDPDFARRAGAPGIFLNTMWYQGLVGRYATDWAGHESFPRRLRVDMRAHSCPGHQLTVTGTVRAKRVDAEGRHVVDLAIEVSHQDRRDAIVADLTLELP